MNNKLQPESVAPTQLGEAVLILGMHRSGTSALTGLLEIFGATTPQKQIEPGAQNPRGFFEAERVARLNDSLLATANLTWDSTQPLPKNGLQVEHVPTFSQQALDILQEEFGQADLIALKDPRICRLVPFWAEVIKGCNRKLFFVLTARHPLEVAQSLEIRNKFSLAQGVLLWMIYVLESEASTRGRPRTFTTYDILLSDPQHVIEQVLGLLGRPMPLNPKKMLKQTKHFISPQLRHHQLNDTEDLPPLVYKVHELLTRWAQTGEDQKDYPFLDRTLRQIQVITRHSDSAENLLRALEMVWTDTPFSESKGILSRLRKPDLLDDATALLRANAALNAVLGTSQTAIPDHDEALNQLRQAMTDQSLQLMRNYDETTSRDRELAVLSQLFINAKSTTKKLQTEKVKFERQVRKLQSEIMALENDRKNLRQQKSLLTKENSELHNMAANVERKRTGLQRENEELHALVARVETERARLHDLATDLEHRWRALINSTSWRITGPLRRVIRLLRW